MTGNIFTVDVEDWFHILDYEETRDHKVWTKFEPRIEQNLNRILRVCEENNVRGTFFILGWIAENYPELVDLIKSKGHEIACHSDKHRLVYEMSEKEFCEDLESAKRHIQDACGVIPTIYRAPGFSILKDTTWAFEKLIDYGFLVDCSIFPTQRAHGGIPNYGHRLPHVMKFRSGKKLTSLPINYCELGQMELVYCGGGYFRILPYWIIRRLIASHDYNMSYFHPRDLDYGQPVLQGLSTLRKMKVSVGLRTAEKKFERLIQDFKWVSIGEYLSHHQDLKCITVN